MDKKPTYDELLQRVGELEYENETLRMAIRIATYDF